MLHIHNTLVSLDLIERCFVCDLNACKGCCCVDGDAGAPLAPGEVEEIEKALPYIWDSLRPEAKAVLDEQGVCYLDIDDETVVSIVGDKDCVFTCYDEDGVCKCAIERAFLKGLTTFRKPVSCWLYPVRVTEYDSYKAVNYERRSICRRAEALGSYKNILLYEYLKDALVARFGQEWYDELERFAKEWKNRPVQE